MNPIIVCPLSEDIIKNLSGEALVVKTRDLDDIPLIKDLVGKRNKLHCIHCVSEKTITQLPLDSSLEGVPLSLHLEKPGPFREYAGKTRLLKQLRLRIFLNGSIIDNYPHIRILSSLGVSSGIAMGGNLHWDSLSDLLYYDRYAISGHEPIEPFNYISINYDPKEYVDFRAVYFNAPGRYIHVDAEGNLAMTEEDLINGNYIDADIDEIGIIKENPGYIKGINWWEKFFLEEEGCAYCPAWRICMGAFNNSDKAECRKFFGEMLEAALNTRQNRKQGSNEIWQP